MAGCHLYGGWPCGHGTGGGTSGLWPCCRKDRVQVRGYTPDWLDWAINERTLDWIVQIVFNFTKKKLEDYMEKKSAETTTVAHFGNVGEDNKNRKE